MLLYIVGGIGGGGLNVWGVERVLYNNTIAKAIEGTR